MSTSTLERPGVDGSQWRAPETDLFGDQGSERMPASLERAQQFGKNFLASPVGQKALEHGSGILKTGAQAALDHVGDKLGVHYEIENRKVNLNLRKMGGAALLAWGTLGGSLAWTARGAFKEGRQAARHEATSRAKAAASEAYGNQKGKIRDKLETRWQARKDERASMRAFNTEQVASTNESFDQYTSNEDTTDVSESFDWNAAEAQFDTPNDSSDWWGEDSEVSLTQAAPYESSNSGMFAGIKERRQAKKDQKRVDAMYPGEHNGSGGWGSKLRPNKGVRQAEAEIAAAAAQTRKQSGSEW